MKLFLFIAAVATVAVVRGYVEPGLLSGEFGGNNAIVAALAGPQGLMCYFKIEFATQQSTLAVTKKIQATITTIVDYVVKGVSECAMPNKVSSHCYSISKQGVIVKGCIADLGFVCLMNKKKVETCSAVDTSPLIGITIATQYGNATITKAAVCGSSECIAEGLRVSTFDRVPLSLYSLVEEDDGIDDLVTTFQLSINT